MKESSHGLARHTIPSPPWHRHTACFHKLAQGEIMLHNLPPLPNSTSGFKVNR